ILLARQFGAQTAKGVEQRQVLRQHRQSGALRAALAAAASGGGVAAQVDLAAALEDFAAGIGQAQSAVALAVHFKQAGGDQLAEHAAPGAAVEVAADAIGAQLVVAALADPVVLAAAQDIDQVADAVALAAAVYGAESRLL